MRSAVALLTADITSALAHKAAAPAPPPGSSTQSKMALLSAVAAARLVSGPSVTPREQLTGPSPARPATTTSSPARRSTSTLITVSISSAPPARITNTFLADISAICKNDSFLPSCVFLFLYVCSLPLYKIGKRESQS